jgi:predicted nucleic acid-binding protein
VLGVASGKLEITLSASILKEYEEIIQRASGADFISAEIVLYTLNRATYSK